MNNLARNTLAYFAAPLLTKKKKRYLTSTAGPAADGEAVRRSGGHPRGHPARPQPVGRQSQPRVQLRGVPELEVPPAARSQLQPLRGH